jgi:hypothetical protein
MARAFHLEAAMVFESVEISTPAEESPAVSWAAIAAGAVAAAALTLVLLAFGAGMGFLPYFGERSTARSSVIP